MKIENTSTPNTLSTPEELEKPASLQLQKLGSKKTSSTQSLELPKSLYAIETSHSPRFQKLASTLFSTYGAPRTLHARLDEGNRALVETADGFQVKFSGEREEWTITSPEGKTTRIWGDPHVEESDGDRWDFHRQSSFIFGNNKITVETQYLRPGVSVSGTVNVYNGNDRFTITDLDINKPRFVDWTTDAQKHDATLLDGDVFELRQESNGDDEWIRK